mmetsp:Transcript_4071/g.4982  ORF Transcript_4071/g.4982 Transcript_4071/m.4982 type:complete len:113 (+) Transcript_4071:311-649(+)
MVTKASKSQRSTSIGPYEFTKSENAFGVKTHKSSNSGKANEIIFLNDNTRSTKEVVIIQELQKDSSISKRITSEETKETNTKTRERSLNKSNGPKNSNEIWSTSKSCPSVKK